MDITKRANVKALQVVMGGQRSVVSNRWVQRPVCASAPEIQLPAFLHMRDAPHINVWCWYSNMHTVPVRQPQPIIKVVDKGMLYAKDTQQLYLNSLLRGGPVLLPIKRQSLVIQGKVLKLYSQITNHSDWHGQSFMQKSLEHFNVPCVGLQLLWLGLLTTETYSNSICVAFSGFSAIVDSTSPAVVYHVHLVPVLVMTHLLSCRPCPQRMRKTSLHNLCKSCGLTTVIITNYQAGRITSYFLQKQIQMAHSATQKPEIIR